jgi:geranylgeranyl transferase type-1 subunit beta
LKGATTLNILDVPENCAAESYKWGHLAMTYTSIAILVILGDDLSRLDRKAIIEGENCALFP